MTIFKSKQDAWLIAVVYTSSFICFIASGYVLAQGLSITNIIIAAVTALVGGVFPIWLIVSLKYVVDEKLLKIICGPFKWHIELSAINSVVPSSDLVSSPALSLDRLLINYGFGKTVLVSPKDKKGFIGAIGLNKV
ncbi:PH domain-containing protein [Thalassotalea sp. LPB0316]|uniref:PH domain-containing protein n=1 Tax=Thalassotalea sp. LPB0316 TaxID=2769490 RepID=UPI0018695ADB|nr:PH domain-containing protein [Thalassotalea sp. LPB0316]QOL24982.1 PH domain-containing protein [Thalassotalea sp. LPB0316]